MGEVAGSNPASDGTSVAGVRQTARSLSRESCDCEVIVRVYAFEPITVASRAKVHLLRFCRSYSPPHSHEAKRSVVEVPSTALGSRKLITMFVYRHSSVRA